VQYHRLLKTVKSLREENAILRQKLGSMEQITRDNVELQRKDEEMSGRMMLLIEEIDDLKKRLTKECKRRIDADEQRCTQKELFLRLFMQLKHDMDKSNSQHASAVMKDKRAPLGEHLRSTTRRDVLPNKRNAAASELFAEDKFKDQMAFAQGMETLSQLLGAAKDSLHSTSPRYNVTPVTNGLGGSMAQGHPDFCPNSAAPRCDEKPIAFGHGGCVAQGQQGL
jgi:hypothetical protein